MKKILLAMLLGLSFYGFSQDVKYGVRGGLNISNLDFEDTPIMANKHRNSFYIGFFGDISFTKTVSLVPELQFSAEGAKLEVFQLDYIQAPILLKFRLSEKFRFAVGPQVGLKVDKVDDGARNMAYSGVAGLDYKLTHTLFADIRYTYGFVDVFEENSGISAKNSNIQLGIGYKF
ncbi:outer membrane protein with beta-barrel domain [Mariniflexile fucanivorans]|uniref:Outer membrane protein with beta-barrel domain n=1 Tax=Mariniflexile fucanivorans TaxID=264023 RepID=A0A4R1RH58_9FLAO|nr:porin family protein [Mariniflexile fucanivorans]TCL65050.1 outer membrane protein with beta-barrel domain [Mariniflexile fucanivorans]